MGATGAELSLQLQAQSQEENSVRKLVLGLAVGILVAATSTTVAPQNVAAASSQTKVVIVVGAVQSVTSSYRADAEAEAAVFAKYTSNITKVYSPNATWGAVSAAARGANILVYLGHGTGYPNPYTPGYEQTAGDNGMGLNASAAGTDNNTHYYGEDYMAQLGLAPNAVVMLNHLCYASGDSEPGKGLPSLAVAKQRVDGYASGFIRGGAKAVLAEGMNDLSYFIDGFFTSHTTIAAMWKANPGFHNHLTSWASTYNPGYTSQIDPDVDHPEGDGDYFYRSMVSVPTLKTDDAISGTIAPFVPQSGTYHPVNPTRVVDTRGNGVGPTGKMLSNGRYTFMIVGTANVPSGAIAVTANLTVTNQTADGWIFLGPAIYGQPGSSTINFPVGDNRANGITVPLSPQGSVDAWYRGSSTGSSTDLILDVTGYYSPGTSGDGYVAYGPHRILDTRDGTGLTGKFEARKPRTIQIAGVAGLPASGIVAIVGNLTVVSPSARGFIFLGPTATSAPTSSTLNFPAWDIRANNFVVPVNQTDGTVQAVFANDYGATADIVMDVSGYFTAGSGAQYHTLDPARILDSRVPKGLTGPIPGNSPQTLQVSGNGGVAAGAVAVTANLTVTQQSNAGFVSVGPTINASTVFSNLNFPTGDDRANGVTVPLTNDGKVQLVYGTPGVGNIQLILDVNGYFQ